MSEQGQHQPSSPPTAEAQRLEAEGRESLAMVQVALAIERFEAAIRQQPDRWACHILLGYALDRLGAHAQAMESLARLANTAHSSRRLPEVERVVHALAAAGSGGAEAPGLGLWCALALASLRAVRPLRQESAWRSAAAATQGDSTSAASSRPPSSSRFGPDASP